MLELDRVKKHLNVQGDADDSLILGYTTAATAHVEQHCDRRLVDGLPADSSEMALTDDVAQAILLLVGHWYSNREAVVVGVSAASVPFAVDALLWYRKRF